jgi:Ca2+-binding EF-hand superfamily protein
MKGYEKYIEPLLTTFRQFDTENKGVITFDQFRELLEQNQLGDHVDQLFEVFEEMTEDSLTLSDIIQALTNEEYEEGLSFLQQIVKD